MEKRCDSCLYNSDCRCAGRCQYYLPYDYEEREIDDEKERDAFRMEYYLYSQEYE